MTPPRLPVTELRAAIDAEQWTVAACLLGDYQAAVMQALARVDLASEPREAWNQLLLEHQAMLAELTCARDKTSETLSQLRQNQRGAHAYLQSPA